MAPKKAAKKAAKHISDNQGEMQPPMDEHRHKKDKDKKQGEKKHRENKDLRRAYEHLGRLTALEQTLTGRTLSQVKTLTGVAQNALLADDPKSAADLLRAAEHLTFGSLAQTTRATRLSPELEDALNAELEHLSEKASDHWKKHDEQRPVEIADLYALMLSTAKASRIKGAYRRALEFARGAEALAHVRGFGAQDAVMLDQKSSLKLAKKEK